MFLCWIRFYFDFFFLLCFFVVYMLLLGLGLKYYLFVINYVKLCFDRGFVGRSVSIGSADL
jgi:hypothetical protein